MTVINVEKEEINDFFKVLTDETRLQIIQLLRDGELCVCELQEELEMSQPSVSYHLRQMVEAGFLLRRREAGWTNYRLNPELPEQVDKIREELGLYEGGFETTLKETKKRPCS